MKNQAEQMVQNVFTCVVAILARFEHDKRSVEMPAASVTCPHCEKSVEIQVTAVTRSRPCPECGQTIMLQVAARSSSFKHKALLMSPTPPTDNLEKPDFTNGASLFPGDAFERMCLDPELLKTRAQFMAGAGMVLALILAAAVVHWMDLWPKVKRPADLVQEVMDDTPKLSSKPLPENSATAPAAALPIQIGSPVKRLSFRPAKPDSTEEVPAVNNDPLSALEKFLAAPTADEKLSLSLNASQVESALRGYYRNHPAGALPYSHIEKHSQSPAGFTEFRVVLRDGTKKFAAVVPTPEGPRVDWASFVALGDLEWEQMRQARPTQPVLMRVLATPAEQFSGPFSNREKLRCLRLVPAADPSATPVYGYVPRDTELASQLNLWLGQDSSGGTPLTLRLCYPAQTPSHDQAWISELVVPGWVMVAKSPPGEGE